MFRIGFINIRDTFFVNSKNGIVKIIFFFTNLFKKLRERFRNSVR